MTKGVISGNRFACGKVIKKFLTPYHLTTLPHLLLFVTLSLYHLITLPLAFAAPVTNLSYISVSSDTLSLQWNLQPETSYQVALSTVPGFNINIASNVSPANQNTTSFFSLQPNTSHTFLVKVSTDADGNVTAISTYTWAKSPGFSGFQIFTTSATVTLLSNGNPTASSTTTFRLQLSTDGFNTVAFSSSGGALSLTVSGLQSNSTYQLGIAALNFYNLASSQTVVATTSTMASPPGSFTTLTAADVGISSITVAWNPNTNPLTPPTSYQVQLSTDISFSVFTDSVTFLLSAASSTLISNTSYYFRARAFSRTGEPTNFNSQIATFTRSASPGFSGFQIFTTSATVNIVANGNARSYRLQASTDGFNTVAFSSSGGALSLTVSGLQSNSTYQLGIAALNFYNLASSQTVVATTSTMASPPGSFTTLTAADVGISSITVAWNPNTNPLTPPTSYQVQLSTDISFSVFTDSVTFLLSATSSTLISNTSYYFRARAFSRTGEPTNFNSQITTFTLAAAPQNLSSTQTVSQITLQWQSNNPSNTRIELSSSTDNFLTQIATPIPFSANFTNTTTAFLNLRENTTYFFRLRAINQNNLISDFSAILATKTFNIAPEGISNLAFDGAFPTNDGEIRWTWTAPGGDEQSAGINVTSYIVRYATFDIATNEFDSPQVSTYTQSWTPLTRGSVEARTVTGLNPGTTYFFAIKGVDSVGNAGFWSTGPAVNSNRSTFAKDLPLAAPTNPIFGLITSSSAALSWTAPPAPANLDDRDTYKVYWATYNFSSASDPFVFQTTGSAHPTVSATVTGLANETTYFFRVTAVDKGDQGSGLYSAALESALSAATSTVTLDRIAPAAISDLTALTGATEGTINLQWSSPGDDGTNKNLVNGSLFEIKYTTAGVITSANYTSPAHFTKTISTTAISGSQQGTLITGLLSAATYYFAIKTKDESGNSALWNSSNDVTTVNLLASTISQRDNVAPNTVTGLALTPAYQRITVNWISPGDDGLIGNLTGFFTIKYGTAPITNPAEFDAAASTVSLSTTAVAGSLQGKLITGLANNLTYYFAVRATDDAGNISAFSAAETKSDFPRNDPPGAFTLNSPFDTFVVTAAPLNVKWNPSTDPNQVDGDTVTYSVHYSTRSDFSVEATTIEAAGVATNKNLAGALIENASYYWRVLAKDNDNAQRFSDTRTFRVNLVNTLPSTFTLLTPQISSIVFTLTPTLDWQDSTDPDPGDGITYTLKYSQNPDAEGGTAVSGLTTSFYTIATALLENTTYYWKALALSTNPFTGTDTMPSIATFSFRTNSVAEAPNAFTLVSPVPDARVTTTLPTFIWQQATDNDPGDTITYTLDITGIGFSSSIPNLSLTTYTYTDPLADNRAYFWKVTAKSSPDNLTRQSTLADIRFKLDTVKQLPPAVALSSPIANIIVPTLTPTLRWTAVTDPDNAQNDSTMDQVRYKIKISKKSDFSDVLGLADFFSDGNGTATQRQFTLEDQTKYFWFVGAAGYQTLNGQSVNTDSNVVTGCLIGGERFQCSNTESFIVSLVNTSPTPPDLLTPANGLSATTPLLQFDWTDSSDPDPQQFLQYALFISTQSDFSLLFFSSAGINSSSFTMPAPLLQNRKYYWKVQVQDRSSVDLSTKGPAVPSLQTFSFTIPILTTPKEPTGVKGTLSADKNSFTIFWNAVGQNTDNTAITDLDGYQLYRSQATTGLGSGTPLTKVTTATLSYTDSTIAGGEFFYTIRAVNTSFQSADSSGTISVNSTVVKSAADQSLLIVPEEASGLQGSIEITIPEDVKSVLEKASNSYGEDLKPRLRKTGASGLKDALFGVEIKIKRAISDQEIAGFTFDKPIKIALSPFGAAAAPKFQSPQAAPAAINDYAVFFNNGVEWLNLGGAVNPSNNTIFVRTRNVGEFAIRKVLKATDFEVSAITPNKIFTPNGDGCNDIAVFQFQNPKGFSGIRGKIFDLFGAFVADLKTQGAFGNISFNPNCPQPNLGDDTLIWDGKDSDGRLVRKGIYIYQIEAEGKAINGTVVVAR